MIDKYNYIQYDWLMYLPGMDWWVSSGTFVYSAISSQRMSTRWTTWRSVRWRLPFHSPPLRPFCWRLRCCPKWARGLALIHLGNLLGIYLGLKMGRNLLLNHRFPSWNSHFGAVAYFEAHPYVVFCCFLALWSKSKMGATYSKHKNWGSTWGPGPMDEHVHFYP